MSRKNPNETSHITMMGMWQILEEAGSMSIPAQKAFAQEIYKEFQAIDDAYGGNTALGAEDIHRVANRVEKK